MFKKNSKGNLIGGIVLDFIIITVEVYNLILSQSIKTQIFWIVMTIMGGVLLGIDVRGLIDGQYEN